MLKYDVAIIGAGAVGCAVAKLLSEYELKICVIEKEADVAFETSGRNSGVVHAGFNNVKDSLKAKLCVEGNREFKKLAEELKIKYEKTGKLVTGFSDKDRKKLEELKKQGENNGVSGLRILNEKEIKEIDPKIQGNFALYSEETAIFDPFEYTIALAETAHANGVDFYFDSKVEAIKKKETENIFEIQCGKVIEAELVINCAGLYSAEICKMLDIDRFDINPCRGEYHIMEKNNDLQIKMPVYPVPDEEKGVLGVHLTPTTGGNIIAGPSAEFLDEKDDFSNKEEVMKLLSIGAEELMSEMRDGNVIRSFSGIRPKLIDNSGKVVGDFVIEESERCKGFIYLVGIESPGMTASYPIAKYVKKILEKSIGQKLIKKEYINKRDCFYEKNEDKYQNDKKMVCRCERVTEGDILEAYDDILRINAFPTIKGIKNRTRAFMGSCQGCFCTIDTVELLRNKRDVKAEKLTYSGDGSNMFVGILK